MSKVLWVKGDIAVLFQLLKGDIAVLFQLLKGDIAVLFQLLKGNIAELLKGNVAVLFQFLKKLHLQERVVDEVKQAIRPFYSHKKITKDEYKEILRKAVPKVMWY